MSLPADGPPPGPETGPEPGSVTGPVVVPSGQEWATLGGIPLPALQRLAGAFHDNLRTLPEEWSAGVLIVGLFASQDGTTVQVVPRAHLMARLPTGDQTFDLLVWDEFAPEDVLDPAVEECGRVETASLLLIHVHSPVGGGAGAQIRLRVGTAPGLTVPTLDDPVWLAGLVRDPSSVFA